MKLLITSLLLLACGGVFGQGNPVRISGMVSDSATSEPMIGASIDLGNKGKGLITNAEGKFLIQCKKGEILHLTIRYLGYKATQVDVVGLADTLLLIRMAAEPVDAGEITVSTDRRDREKQLSSAMLKVQGRELRQLPRLMGESDVMRTLQYTPGVSYGGDANAGLYVRGGGADQNLILLDNAPVYNPSHLLGFFSTFNSEVIQSLEFYRTGAPVEFDSRLSSAIDIATIYPNMDNYSYTGNIGLISSNGVITGPLLKKKCGFFVAGRISYLDQLIKPVANSVITSESVFLDNTSYNFYDLNAKLSVDAGKLGYFSLTGFVSRDKFGLLQEKIDFRNQFRWGNTLSALNWMKQTPSGWLWESTLSLSEYYFKFYAARPDIDASLYSSVRNPGLRLAVSGSLLPSVRIKTGVSAQGMQFRPNNIEAKAAEIALNFGSNQLLQAYQSSAFVQMHWTIARRVTISGGMRVSIFTHTGPYSIVGKDALGQAGDTITYGSNEPVKTYYLPEPQISISSVLSRHWSVKAGYSHNEQSIHQVSSSAVTLPIDVWLPSTARVRPQSADQIFAALMLHPSPKLYEAELNVYFKRLDNQIELLYGLINNFEDNTFEESMTFGKGESYGTEFIVKRNEGSITGWLSYTLARAVRQFDEINEGYLYPATYDRRHQLTALVNWSVNKRWTLSASFIYASGQAMTIPEGKYIIAGNILNINSETNGFRMPDYHRLDVSVNYFFRKDENRESGLNLSVFNVYNRPNPFYITFEITGDGTSEIGISAKGVSIFPILPSLSWFFRF